MSRQIRRFYEFGPYRIDSVNRLLLRSGEPVALKAKVVDTLLLLLDRAGEVVEKEELMSRLWPDSFVEEANLTQNIYVLRKALADADHIETIPRRGYRFVTAVRVREDVVPESPAAEPEAKPETPMEPIASPAPAAGPAIRRRSRLPLAIGAATGVAAVAILGFWLWPAKTPFREIRLTRLTTTGKATRAAISPDGKYLAFVESDAGKQSLRLKQIATGKDLELVAPAAVDYYGLTFSRDGSFLYYVSQEFNRVGILFRVPALGGTPSKLVEDVDSPVTLSPDDRRLAYIRYTPGRRSIFVAAADGSGERRLATTASGSALEIAPIPLVPPAWSPDGKAIACAVAIAGPRGEYQTVRAFDAESGAGRALTAERWQAIGRIEWLPGGTGLVAAAAEMGTTSPQQIWLLEAGGEARRLTADLGDYRDLSLTSAAGTLAAVQTERRGNVWVARADGGEPRQLTSTNYDGLGGLAWTPDGRVVYTLQSGAEQALWIADPRGGSPEPITRHAGVNRQPAVSPDGRYVVFVSNRSGRERLWRMDIGGANAVELTHGESDVDPSFSSDGKSVIYKASVSGLGYISRVPVEGGEPLRLTERPAGGPVVSPDGSLIAVYFRPGTSGASSMAILPFSGGEPQPIRELPAHMGRFRWTPDGRQIAWSGRQRGVGNLWGQPIVGGEPATLTSWSADPVFSFDWSRDGKWLAYSKGTITSDVVLIAAAGR